MSYTKTGAEGQTSASPRGALHQAARDLAARGIPVFPTWPGTKTPATRYGFHDATTDLKQIDAWWESEPNFNVAMQPQKAGWAVVDPDGLEGIAAWEELQIEHGQVPSTYTVRTPRGGYHFYFKGDLPPTQSKLAPHVDTRGGGSYVLVPPSVFEGKPYTVDNSAPPAPLPDWIAPIIGKAREKARAAVGELDLPENLARAGKLLDDYVKRGHVAIEGQMGDLRTFQVACEVQNLGVSPEVCMDLMADRWNPHCQPPWDDDDLTTKIANAAAYAQNEAGAWAVEPAEDVFRAALDNLPPDEAPPARRTIDAGDPEWRARVASFMGREPDEDADLPEPEFWDADKILPKFPGGCTGVAYGESGAGKTTVVLAVIMEAIQSRGARVAILAGEGAYGLGKMRVPAQCEAHGITPQDLRGKYRTIARVPNLTDPLDTEALIEAQRDFNPDIVVVDTLATALPGADENAASTGSLLTGNGPAGRIRAAFNAAVVFVAHSGKDAKKGPRGSSAFSGNVDFVWEITTDKLAGTARLHVRKMKDGPDGFCVYYRVAPAANGVPVARRMSEADYKAIHRDEASGDRQEVAQALRAFHEPVTTRVLAMELVPREKGQDEDEAEVRIVNEIKRLQALARPHRRTGAPGILAGYLVRDHRGQPLTPIQWDIPRADVEDADDD